MLSGQNFLLQDFCAPALVDARDFEYLCRVDIGVIASAHDGDAANHALIYLEDRGNENEKMRNKKTGDLNGGVYCIVDLDIRTCVLRQLGC